MCRDAGAKPVTSTKISRQESPQMTEWTEGISVSGGPVILRDGVPATIDEVLEQLRGSGWRSIETAPKDGTEVIIETNAHARGMVFACMDAAGGWYEEDGDRHYPKMWQPLPPPPTEKE